MTDLVWNTYGNMGMGNILRALFVNKKENITTAEGWSGRGGEDQYQLAYLCYRQISYRAQLLWIAKSVVSNTDNGR